MNDDNCIHGEIDANNITTHADMKLSIGASTPPPPTILIQNPATGRHLLSIHPDGTVTGEIEDASEAARVFVESLRGYFPQPQTDALKKAERALGAFMERYQSGFRADTEYVADLVRKALAALKESK